MYDISGVFKLTILTSKEYIDSERVESSIWTNVYWVIPILMSITNYRQIRAIHTRVADHDSRKLPCRILHSSGKKNGKETATGLHIFYFLHTHGRF